MVCVSGETEIGELEYDVGEAMLATARVGAQQYVARLEVAMDDVGIVQVEHAARHLRRPVDQYVGRQAEAACAQQSL